MIVAFVQLALTMAAALLVWRLWRREVRSTPHRWIVGLGFLARVAGGLLLFWIAWFQVPQLDPLYTRRGVWFFAMDGNRYIRWADMAVRDGMESIIFFPRFAPSVTYIQFLAVGKYLFGTPVSVALFLNVVAFLATAILIIRWPAPPDQQGRWVTPRNVALVLALAPSSILWSLQPLKEAMFQVLVVLFFAAAAWWQQYWLRGGSRWMFAGSVAVMIAAIFLISGTRNYIGMVLVAATAPFFFLVGMSRRGNKVLPLAAGALVFVMLVPSFVKGSGRVPSWLRPLTSVSSLASGQARLPSVTGVTERTRSNFEAVGGETVIRPGATLRALRASAGSNKVVLTAQRFAAGLAAALFPERLMQTLGIVEIRGGRGMLWLTNIDTIFIDVIVVISFVLLFRTPGWYRSPMVWLLLLTAFVIGTALVYAVVNFGTLVRLRQFVVICLSMLPLVAVMRRDPEIASPRG